MKKLFVFFTIVALTTLSVFGQWEVVKQGDELLANFATRAYGDGFMLDVNNGWFVGDNGHVIKTVDGGATWTTLRDDDASGLDWLDVEFYDANTGYACGEDGYIFKTTDGGANWDMIGDTANYTADLKFLKVIDANMVFFAGKGATLLKTTNGGTDYVKSGNTFEGLDLDGGMNFCSANVGVVASDDYDGYTWYTHDGGTTWNLTRIDELFPYGILKYSVKSVGAGDDSTIVLGTRYQCILVSQNGGKSYTLMGDYTYALKYDYSTVVIDENTFILGGSNTTVKTVDGGASWDTLKTGTQQNVMFMNFFDANNGFVFAEYNQWMKTTDGGVTFTPIIEWPNVNFRGIGATSNTIFVTAFAGGEITTSNDGGLTWSYPTNYLTGAAGNLLKCKFFDDDNGIIVGGDGNLFITTDGGASWTFSDNPMYTVGKSIYTVAHYSADTIFAGGSSGYLMRSVDGGLIWSDTYLSATKSVYGILPLSGTTFIAVGQSGYLYKGEFLDATTIDDSLYTTGTSDDFNAIVSYGDSVILVSDEGSIFKASLDNLGSLNQIVVDVATDELNDIEFIDDNLLFVAGKGGKVYRSEDTGQTWTAETSPTTETIYDIIYTNNALWGETNFGGIIKREFHPPVTFQVNMSAQIALGNFVPGTDYLDVAGSFNGWGASDSLSDADGDSIYTITLEIPEGAIEYKFRFNGNWDTSESISNRQYTVVAGENVLPVVWYSDFDPASSVNAEVYFYADMSIQLLNKNFQPDSGDIVIIRGGFNGWSGEDNELTLDPSVTGLYVAAFKMNNLSLDAANEFKFVIHYSDGSDAWESSPNRSFTIPTGHTYEDLDNDGYYEVPTDTAFFADAGWDDIIQQDVTVYFSVDILSAVKALNAGEVLIDSQTDADTIYSADEIVGVYINGLLGSWWDWGSNPVEFALVDDGTNGDATADDGIYTLGILFTAGQAKEQLYKYGINSLDNEAGFAENRSVVIDDASSTFYPETVCYGSQNLDDRLPFPEYDCTEVGIDNEAYVLPDRFILHRNYPNPFNPTTNIAFEMPVTENVKLEVYNILGHKVKTMQSGTLNAGFHVYEWNATNDAGQQMAAGVYIYRLTTAKKTLQKKLVLLK